MNNYENVISLGYFCSVSLDLKELGLRSFSTPFEWVLCEEFEQVIKQIKTHFENFLDYDSMSQSKTELTHYKNEKTGMVFFHDFDRYQPLLKQFDFVVEKYNRRIPRFYERISKPTLFIRYIGVQCDDVGNNIDADWISKNFTLIIDTIKSFNKDNDIIFIANSDVKNLPFDCFYVDKDENDIVNRKPLFSNKELYSLLNAETNKINKELNKQHKDKKRPMRLFSAFKKVFFKKYIHSKQFDE